jgi:WD40 repeat protein
MDSGLPLRQTIGRVQVWNVESGSEIVVGIHVKEVESVLWSADGQRISSNSRDGTCRMWDANVQLEELVTRARHRVYRELSATERRNLMLSPPD